MKVVNKYAGYSFIVVFESNFHFLVGVEDPRGNPTEISLELSFA